MRDFLVRLYPKQWRDRYGAEFRALLDDHPPGLRDALDIIVNAGREHVRSNTLRVVGTRLGGVLAALSVLLLVAGLLIREEGAAEFLVIVSPLIAALAWPALLRLAGPHWRPLAYGILGVLLLGVALPTLLFDGGQAGLMGVMGVLGVYGVMALAAAWLVRSELPRPAALLTAMVGFASITLSLTQLLYHAGLIGVGLVGAGVALWALIHLAWTATIAVILLIRTPADLTAALAG